jgi:hypothetical protein
VLPGDIFRPLRSTVRPLRRRCDSHALYSVWIQGARFLHLDGARRCPIPESGWGPCNTAPANWMRPDCPTQRRRPFGSRQARPEVIWRRHLVSPKCHPRPWPHNTIPSTRPAFKSDGSGSVSGVVRVLGGLRFSSWLRSLLWLCLSSLGRPFGFSWTQIVPVKVAGAGQSLAWLFG